MWNHIKTKYKFFICPKWHPFSAVRMVAVTLWFGVLASSAQTGQYLFTGSMTNITLNPGIYDITAYGAQGGQFYNYYSGGGSLGAEMKARFSFATAVNLTLLVGGAGGGGGGGYSGGGGGTGAYNYFDGGGGGGSIIDSSAVAIITEVSGVASPDGSPNGEIIITAVPKPITLALASTAGGQFGFNITGPTNATIVVAACTNLANPVWIPLATNTLSNGTKYFSDAQWTNYPYRFYRVSEP